MLASRNKRIHFSRINGGTVPSVSRQRYVPVYVPLRAPTETWHKVAITVNHEKKTDEKQHGALTRERKEGRKEGRERLLNSQI